MPRQKPMESRRNREPSELRSHCVSCRMNDSEIAQLDARRGKYARGEYLRLALNSALPPPAPPEINREAWVTLAKAAGNLATMATAMRGGEYVPLDEITTAIADFRRELIGAKP